MDYLLEKYRSEWSPIITADDYQYGLGEISPEVTATSDGTKVTRIDFQISNPKGKKIECSIYKHESGDRPCLVYSHSHSGNKAEGAHLVDAVVDYFSLVIFDYTGYGYSDKDHCTLGLKEQEDLKSVVEYVRKTYEFKDVYCWARSMGAVTALLLSHRERSGIFKGMVIDSPFSSTKEMVTATV